MHHSSISRVLSHPIMDTIRNVGILGWHAEQFTSVCVVVVVERWTAWEFRTGRQTCAMVFGPIDDFQRCRCHSTSFPSIGIGVDPESLWLTRSRDAYSGTAAALHGSCEIQKEQTDVVHSWVDHHDTTPDQLNMSLIISAMFRSVYLLQHTGFQRYDHVIEIAADL